MSLCKMIASLLLAGIVSALAVAQNPPVMVPLARGGVRSLQKNHPRQEPCWQVAGISKSAMEQERAVHQQAR